jgi:aminobenzoyl-glutamate transport protein
MSQSSETSGGSAFVQRFLNAVEWAGNKLPDPAFLFVWAMLLTMVSSLLLANVEFTDVDPRSGEPITVVNQFSGEQLTVFLTSMVETFTGFPPLGVVLVALLGVGVAEQTGYIQAMLRKMLKVTPVRFLTPMLIIVSIVSHAAGDTGYVLIIPLGAVMFQAAGRHPLLGICAAFAGVSGGFSANFLPSSLDPLLQGFTQQGANIVDPEITVNPLCNYYFMTASCLVITAVGWFLTDRILEPRLQKLAVDGDGSGDSTMGELSAAEATGLNIASATLVSLIVLLAWAAFPADSPLRGPAGQLTTRDAPLMHSIVPLIFLLFLIPGVVYGVFAGSVKSHRDVIGGMKKSMDTITYYLVMAFFAAQFTAIFSRSNIGVLIAVKGAGFLAAWNLPGQVTIFGIILLTCAVNLLVGSASAKWALLSPIFVPMLMALGLSPELTQAAYRIGDSSTNIVTPLMPYFPLVVAFSQKYVRSTGIGTMISLMLPYCIGFLFTWTVLLLIWWGLGLPLGLQAGYSYVAG